MPALSDDQIADGLRSLGDQWRNARAERQQRTRLERADFDAIRSTGFLQTVVPVDQGGTWRGVDASVRPIAGMLRTLGAADPSVALVSAMHPAVLVFWLSAPDDHDPIWIAQRQAVVASGDSGHRWGTMTSEPGSGGDILQTKAAAEPAAGKGPVPGDCYEISGVKHFGSGSGINDMMITTAVPAGESEPDIFVLDVGGRPWDGSEGLTLLAEWDGVGMAATQSHSMQLDAIPAVRFALDRPLAEIGLAANPFVLTIFTAVVVGVLDSAVDLARDRLRDRTLRAFERVEWTTAEQRYWLAQQALEGSIAAVESGDPLRGFHAALRAKQSAAELAEDILARLARVLGGGSFSSRSPFAHWYEDVRALGFLRPPWALAHDQMFDTSW